MDSMIAYMLHVFIWTHTQIGIDGVEMGQSKHLDGTLF